MWRFGTVTHASTILPDTTHEEGGVDYVNAEEYLLGPGRWERQGAALA